jgi:hypothetical protein
MTRVGGTAKEIPQNVLRNKWASPHLIAQHLLHENLLEVRLVVFQPRRDGFLDGFAVDRLHFEPHSVHQKPVGEQERQLQSTAQTPQKIMLRND